MSLEIDQRQPGDHQGKLVIRGSIFSGTFLVCAMSLALTNSEFSGAIPICIGNVVMGFNSVADGLAAKRRASIAVRCLAVAVLICFLPTIWARAVSMASPIAHFYEGWIVLWLIACMVMILQQWIAKVYLSHRCKTEVPDSSLEAS
jgi:hypothetical protein